MKFPDPQGTFFTCFFIIFNGCLVGSFFAVFITLCKLLCLLFGDSLFLLLGDGFRYAASAAEISDTRCRDIRYLQYQYA